MTDSFIKREIYDYRKSALALAKVRAYVEVEYYNNVLAELKSLMNQSQLERSTTATYVHSLLSIISERCLIFSYF